MIGADLETIEMSLRVFVFTGTLAGSLIVAAWILGRSALPRC